MSMPKDMTDDGEYALLKHVINDFTSGSQSRSSRRRSVPLSTMTQTSSRASPLKGNSKMTKAELLAEVARLQNALRLSQAPSHMREGSSQVALDESLVDPNDETVDDFSMEQ